MKPKSRPERWEAAAAEARKQYDAVKAKINAIDLSPLNDALSTLREVKEEYEEWQGNLPESLQSSPVASKLEAVTSIDIPDDVELNDLAGDSSDVENAIDECEGADLPKGFGRD